MVDVWLPYGKTEVCVRVPARNILGSIEPKDNLEVPNAKAEIERALENPISSKRLSEIVKSEHKIALVVDDATRSTPSHLMIPPLLEELNVAGVKDENITIIFACGMHRKVEPQEATKIIGKEILNRIKVINHDYKAQDLIFVGKTSRNNKIYLNRVFAEADVKILTGDVSFHYYAGYGGGRKSVLPGVSGEKTIKHNHKMLLHPNAKAGTLKENPVNEDMIEAARLAKVDFILNVVLNRKGEIVKAFAGDLEQAFYEGVKVIDQMYRVTVNRKANIVIVCPGGHPADLNLYQSYKGVDNALQVVKRGGVIILVAECPEGHGNQDFYDWMIKFDNLKTVERALRRNFNLGGNKAYYLLKALQNHHIILVSSIPDYYATNVFKLKTARAVNYALSEAFRIAGKNIKIWAVPYGNFTLPEVKPIKEGASIDS